MGQSLQELLVPRNLSTTSGETVWTWPVGWRPLVCWEKYRWAVLQNYRRMTSSVPVNFLLVFFFFSSVQVTEETSGILSTLGYMCSCRGIINVKGKGDLKTYFVHTEMTRSLSQGTVMPWACNTNEQIRLENTITHTKVAVEVIRHAP